jgi:hypothetical protein
MEDKQLTPSESLALISKIIVEAKSRFRDNGFSYIFLGICISVASFGHFVLIKIGFHNYYYPYFIMPIAGFVTYFYYYQKFKGKTYAKNPISSLLAFAGGLIGINTTIIGFFFWYQLGAALFPVMFILLSLWAIFTGIAFKFKIITVTGVLVNIIAYISFFIKDEYHPLILSVVCILAFVVPGIALNQSLKNSHV